MPQTHIKAIKIKNYLALKEHDLRVSDSGIAHIILTGKNGSGKSTLLGEINKFLSAVLNGQLPVRANFIRRIQRDSLQIQSLENQLLVTEREEQKLKLRTQITDLNRRVSLYNERLAPFGNVLIEFTSSDDEITAKAKDGKFLVAYFGAKRKPNLRSPQGIHDVKLKTLYQPNDRINSEFIQYLVNKKADRSFARDDGNLEAVHDIDAWFINLESHLQDIFNSASLKLKFDRATYGFLIVEDGKPPYAFDALSDGYSAILDIISELILRMDAHAKSTYEIEGIVLIDELETHLHVDLQKKILPFLTDFFPNIQFIVSTHSPFVLSSLPNCVIYDLERSIQTKNLTGYSYSALIESYFGSDTYSETLKHKVSRHDYIYHLGETATDTEKQELKELRTYFSSLPDFFSEELMVKIQDIRLRDLLSRTSALK